MGETHVPSRSMMPKRSASPSVASPAVGAGFFYGVAERGEIFFGDVGAGAVEKRVAIGAHRGDFDAVIGENFVEIAGAAAVQGVDDEFRFAFFEDVEFDEFAEALQIGVAKIDDFGLCVFVARRFGNVALRGEFRGAGFDVFRDFGQRWACVGAGEFKAVILGGIVAGGEVDGAVDFGALDFVGDGGSRRERFAEQRFDFVLLKDIDGELGEFFGVEARVVADEDGGVFLGVVDVAGDGGDCEPHVGEREVVGDKAAPAGGAEFDGG